MESSPASVSQKIESFLSATRILKRIVKQSSKAHSKLEEHYKRIINTSDTNKIEEFQEAFQIYKSYISSYLKRNE